MKRPRHTLMDLFGDRKSTTATVELLKERGVEVLAPTNEYEVVRFRSNGGVGVVYRNLKGRFSANTQAEEALAALFTPGAGSLAPVAIAKRRVTGERRAGELSAIIERDGRGCFFCGGMLPPRDWSAAPGDAPTIEHLVARAHGGPEHISNKFAAHKRCNELAGHLSAPEKIVMREQMRAEHAAKAQAVAA